MTVEEAKSFLIDISYKLGNMAVEYLTEKDGEKMREAIEALEQQSNRCDSCIHSEEQDGSNCYECVKGMADNFEAQQTDMRDATEEERKSVKDYIESISKPTGVQFDTQLTDAKETIIKSALKYLVKMQIEEGSVGFAVDNDPDHDCCWDELLAWLEAQPCEDCISRESVIEWLKDKDIIKTKNQEENARRELGELPSVTPSYNSVKTELKSCDDCTVIKKLSKKYYVEDTYGYTDEDIVNKVNEIIDAVNELPVTPERPKGKWIKCKSRFGVEYFKCSECGRRLDWIDGDDNYCNNCGSDNSESTKEWFKERDTKLVETSRGGEDKADN